MSLPKLKNWYHATDIETARQIVASGYLLPQAHRGDDSLGIFFANSGRNAGLWCNLRGLKEYVVFKIPRNRLNPNLMFESNAHSILPCDDMIVMRYLDKVKISSDDGANVKDGRDFNIPGTKFITEGTKKLRIEITDLKEFENFIQSNPQLSHLLEDLETAE